MALFSPRPLTDSGELAASTPGLFLFPCKEMRETGRERCNNWFGATTAASFWGIKRDEELLNYAEMQKN